MSLGPGTSSSSPLALPAAALSGLGLSVNNTASWPAIRSLWLLPFTLARRRERFCLYLAPVIRLDSWKKRSMT